MKTGYPEKFLNDRVEERVDHGQRKLNVTQVTRTMFTVEMTRGAAHPVNQSEISIVLY